MKKFLFPQSKKGKVLFWVFVALILFANVVQDNEPINTIPYVPPKPDFSEECLSAWDGSNHYLIDAVKKRMNDPSSFIHTQTKYKLQGDVAILIMDFRGKNSFGGLVPSQVMATVDAQTCELIKINRWD